MSSRVWYSPDDGDTWHDVTNQEPDFAYPNPTPPTEDARSCFRYTDIVVSENGLLWGSDDLLGPLAGANPDLARAQRSGSRLFYSPKSNPLDPVEIAFCGMPIRNIIDIGSAFLVLTEAKYTSVSLQPQVFALFKDRPGKAHHLFSVDNFSGKPTGLSYSKASRRAINGRFFTFRDGHAAFPDGARMLQWDVNADWAPLKAAGASPLSDGVSLVGRVVEQAKTAARGLLSQISGKVSF